MTEAPRWRLNSPHYLNVEQLSDGTKIEWEHKEINTANGRMARKLFPVPMALDPKDPTDHNYPGEIIVSTRSPTWAEPLVRDYIFTPGIPTPEMEPLNETAQTLTDAWREKWDHPINSLPANGGMNSQEQEFMAKMMEGFARQIGAALPQAGAVVPNAEVGELKERLAKLEALLATQVKPAVDATARRA